MVSPSTCSAYSRTAPRPSQSRSASASCTPSSWVQPTFSTRSRPSASRAGAVHEHSPPGWNGGSRVSAQRSARSATISGSRPTQARRRSSRSWPELRTRFAGSSSSGAASTAPLWADLAADDGEPAGPDGDGDVPRPCSSRPAPAGRGRRTPRPGPGRCPAPTPWSAGRRWRRCAAARCRDRRRRAPAATPGARPSARPAGPRPAGRRGRDGRAAGRAARSTGRVTGSSAPGRRRVALAADVAGRGPCRARCRRRGTS